MKKGFRATLVQIFFSFWNPDSGFHLLYCNFQTSSFAINGNSTLGVIVKIKNRHSCLWNQQVATSYGEDCHICTGYVIMNKNADGYWLPDHDEWKVAAKGVQDYIYAG